MLFSWATVSAAQLPDNLPIRAGEHPTFDRLVFDWHNKVTFVVDQRDEFVKITFSSPAQAKYSVEAIASLTRLKNFSPLTDKGGQFSVSFNIAPKSKIKIFNNDNAIVVDIEGGELTDTQSLVSSNANQNLPSKKDSIVENKKPDERTEVHQQDSTPIPLPKPVLTSPPVAEQANNSSSLSQGALLQKSPPEPEKQNTNKLKSENPNNQSALSNASPVVSGRESITLPVSPVPSQNDALALPVPPSAVTQEESNALVMSKSEVKETEQIPVSESTVVSNIEMSKNSPIKEVVQGITSSDIGEMPLLVLSLDPHTPTRAAVFARAGYAYIVFDRKLTLSLATLIQGLASPRVTIEPLDMARFTGFRFQVVSDVSLHASRNGTVWQIYLSRQSQDVPVSTTLVAQPDFALGARYLLPLPDAPEPVRMTDPVVGDDLILIPLAQNEAFSIARNMANFQIIPAAQGLVIKPLSDKVIARSVTDGIEITAEGGLDLSSASDTGASLQSSQKARQAEAGKSIFDFSAWRGKPAETFTEARQRLEQTVVDVPEAERNRARLELARFYFSYGNGEESLALLNYLSKQLPDLLAHSDFIALLGASEILAHRPDQGLKHLESPYLKNQPEIELWQAVAAADLRQWKDAEEKFSITVPMLYGYPEPFHSRFAILAIESALATDKNQEAADWLNQLESISHSELIEPAIRYAHAVLHAKAGRAQSAELAWREVADSDDRLYKVRAEMALVDLGVSTGSLTAVQATDRLEALRFAWRGDDLEVDILHRLGQFYVQAKNVKAGLNVLSQAVQLYPSSPLTPQIQSEMSSIFHNVFLSDLGTSLSPLDALTLYQQYRNLMPTGKEGDAVIRNLSERLVAVDLLEQAATLLDDMVKYRLHGEEKARVGTRLAAIRLLDHKPELALSSLDYSNGEFLASDIQNDRLLLRAKALSELHRDDEALALLKDNNHESAKLLRADITMHAKHWEDAAKALLELIGPPPMAGEVLHQDQAEWLVNCAIAMSLSGNTVGLDKLSIDYGAAMAGTSLNSTFRVLTAPEKTTQLRDITAAQARIADVDMFQKFLNTYRNGASVSDKIDATKKP